MIIAYTSRTGNVRRFIGKLKLDAVQVEEGLSIDEPFIFVTYTTGFGQVPEQAYEFLQNNYHYLKGVSASGNRNWGQNFAGSADRISAMYGVPVIHKFELSGTNRDVETFMQGVKQVASY